MFLTRTCFVAPSVPHGASLQVRPPQPSQSCPRASRSKSNALKVKSTPLFLNSAQAGQRELRSKGCNSGGRRRHEGADMAAMAQQDDNGVESSAACESRQLAKMEGGGGHGIHQRIWGSVRRIKICALGNKVETVHCQKDVSCNVEDFWEVPLMEEEGATPQHTEARSRGNKQNSKINLDKTNWWNGRTGHKSLMPINSVLCTCKLRINSFITRFLFWYVKFAD